MDKDEPGDPIQALDHGVGALGLYLVGLTYLFPIEGLATLCRE